MPTRPTSTSPPAVTPTGGPGRARRRREETRRRLLEAATLTISESGVAALSAREVAERADVGRGSFYNHFASIDDLITAVASETLEDFARAVTIDVPDDADPAMVAAVAAARTVRLAVDDPELAHLIVNLDHAKGVFMDTITPYARWLLARGVEADRFHIADVDIAAITIAGGGLALIRAILQGSAPANPVVGHAEAVLRNIGIAPDEARELSLQAVRRDSAGSEVRNRDDAT